MADGTTLNAAGREFTLSAEADGTASIPIGKHNQIVNIHIHQKEEDKKSSSYLGAYLHRASELALNIFSASYYPFGYVVGVAAGAAWGTYELTAFGPGSVETEMQQEGEAFAKGKLEVQLTHLAAKAGLVAMSSYAGAGDLASFAVGARSAREVISQVARIVSGKEA